MVRGRRLMILDHREDEGIGGYAAVGTDGDAA
jgi:hypothetical protein